MNELGVKKITEYFEEKYKNPVPRLKYNSEYQLLIAVMLSAQCTDERVNKVTEVLFKEYGTPEKMLRLTQPELEKFIYSCGLYRSKAEHVLSATRDIMKKFGGKVPSNFSDLNSLAGVGRKTANVVYSVAFSGNAIAVDTHVFRVANRLGLANAKDVIQTENQLKRVLPEEKWSKYHHYLIFHGRDVCSARKPDCAACAIKQECDFYLSRENQKNK